jgi:AhpD family alkylhydroperoxidase
MEEHIKELIAVGASITANCHPCLRYHVSKAREYGAAEAEITEAMTMGKMVRKGAAGQTDKVALSVISSVEVPASIGETGCGCS